MQLIHVDRLNDQDAQILKLESGNVRGHTCKLVILEARESGAAPSVEELRERIATRLSAILMIPSCECLRRRSMWRR